MDTPSTGLYSLTQEQLYNWAIQANQHTKKGQLPDYIPRLTQANSEEFAVQAQRSDGKVYTAGDITLSFPLMSVIKPFLFLYLLEQLGAESLFSCVGMEPSEYPFNSLVQLKADGGFPRNPMLNSGAIALSSLLPGNDAISRSETLRQWLNEQAKCSLVLDEIMLTSVRSLVNERNRNIAQKLADSGYLDTSAEVALDTYERICCLSGTVTDLAQLGLLLLSCQAKDISPKNSCIVKAIMSTCGLYEYSARFAVEVGLPTKSGVSGALLSIVPREGVIAYYSPPLDSMGNSIAGVFLLKQLAQSLNLSVFN